MPEWNDSGIILSAKKYGEKGLIINLLTQEHGRHLGWVNINRNRKNISEIQVGNIVQAFWKARLSDQMGHYKIEVISSVSGKIFDDRLKLQALSSVCSLIDIFLPERESYIKIYKATIAFINMITLIDDDKKLLWLEGYVKWEIGVLSSIGYSLDLSKCAVTGEKNNLCFVSPKTGKAVTQKGAGNYAPKLFRLPYFLGGIKDKTSDFYRDILLGLKITTYFFKNKLLTSFNNNKLIKLPDSRSRLIEMIENL